MSNCYVRFLLLYCLVGMTSIVSTAQSSAGTMPIDVRNISADIPTTVTTIDLSTGCVTGQIFDASALSTSFISLSIDTILSLGTICDDAPIQVILNEVIPCASVNSVRAILISPDGDTLNAFPFSPDCIRGTATSVREFFLISDELQSLNAGTYTVIVENTPYMVELEFDFSLPVDIRQLQPNNNLCDGDSVTLRARVLLDLFDQYIFTWTRPDGTTFEGETIEVTQSGIYAVEALEVGPFGRLGCKRGLASYEVESSLVIDIPNEVTVCPNEAVMICASTNGGGDTITFIWSTRTTGNCIQVSAGTYSLTATDENGCQDEASVTVIQEELPSIIILEECEQDEEGNGILVIQTEAANELLSAFPNVNSYVSGEYKIYRISGITVYPVLLYIVNPETGCTKRQDIIPDCDCPPIAAPPSSIIEVCEEEEIAPIGLDIPEGLELCWYDVPTGGEPLFKDGILELEAIIYYIAYRDIVTGCLSPRASFEIRIRELPRITTTGNTVTCGDELTEICTNVEDGFAVDYQWSDGQNRACSYLSAGTYTVSVTNEYGCEGVATIEITEGIPEERFQREPVCEKSEVRTETQIIQSVQGCDSLLLTTEYILEDNPEDCLRLYIPNAFSPNGDDVNDVFQIFMNSTIVEEIEMHIFNRYGEQVFFTKNKNEFWDGKYQNKRFNSDIFTYVLQIITTDKKAYTYTGSLSLIR